jgi:hypothetical protein
MKLPKINRRPTARHKRWPEPTTASETAANPVAPRQSAPPAQITSQASRLLPTPHWSISQSGHVPGNVPEKPAMQAEPADRVPGRCTVRFVYENASAGEVFLAGSFNNWDARATQMGLAVGAKWVTELSLAPGRYEYLFVVDGRWTFDPKATDYVPNPFGGRNSVLRVG